MSDSSTQRSGGGLGALLFVVFLVLKLCGVIGWSWWWVTAPLWIPALIVLAMWLVLAVAVAIAALLVNS